MVDISEFLAKVSSWATSQPDIAALALVGSHARGTASVSSDIDLVILVANPDIYLDDTAWAGAFGQVERQQLEEWGQVSSLRVWYADGREVEFGVTDLGWAANPIDEGTASVIAGGIQVLYERDRFLSARIGDKEA